MMDDDDGTNTMPSYSPGQSTKRHCDPRRWETHLSIAYLGKNTQKVWDPFLEQMRRSLDYFPGSMGDTSNQRPGRLLFVQPAPVRGVIGASTAALNSCPGAIAHTQHSSTWFTFFSRAPEGDNARSLQQGRNSSGVWLAHDVNAQQRMIVPKRINPEHDRDEKGRFSVF